MATKVEAKLEMYMKIEVITYSGLKDLILNSKDKELIQYFNDAIERESITLHSQVLGFSHYETQSPDAKE